MDLVAIRARLCERLQGAGFNPYASLPPSPDLPAVVVGYPEQITYTITAGRAEILIPVRVYASMADDTDAVNRLDRALSTQPGSVWFALRVADPEDPWRQLVCKSANNIGGVALDGGVTALAGDLNLTITTNQ